MPLFKAYDIRGTVPDELNAEIAYRIGRATARFLATSAIAFGRDARSHSPELFAAACEGVRDEGVDVVDLGLVSTPMLYFGVEQLGTGGGLMLTASHNPARYNGFKVTREHAIPVGRDTGLRDIEALTDEVRRGEGVGRRGALREADVRDAYVEHVLRVGQPVGGTHLAIDCGNGMASIGLEPLIERLALRVERLYFEPDGSFPNHEADPLKVENLRDVADAVRRSGAQLGVAFDGDGDRAVFVDETGEPIPADLVTGLLARHQLRRHPGGRVLFDLRSSRVTAEEIEAAGGVAEMCRVGHSFVKARMREVGAIFAGELSGHVYFRFSDTLVADDGTAALVALLDALAVEAKPLSELIAPLRRYAASGEINRRVEDTAALLDEIEAEHAGAPEVSRLDGLLVRYPDWWFNLRPSNTEPVLRLNLEAATSSEMEAHRDALLRRIGGEPA